MNDATPDAMLSGVRVLDLTRLLPGPFCSLLLADMGADVLKIEDTHGGDYARGYPPYVGGTGAFFAAVNRNKRSMTLNLKAPTGVEIFKRLVRDADVVLESFRPGVLARLGVGYDTLAAIHPGLVYCAITGYGQTGPLKDRAGHDLNYMALAGMLEQNGRHGEAPVVPGFQVADIAGGGLYAALGIVSALFARERTGRGRFVDISMTEGALSFLLPAQASIAAGQPAPRGGGMLTGGVPCYNVYETADGRFLSVGALEPKFWRGFLEVIGAPELSANALDHGEEGAKTRGRIAAILEERTLDEWLQRFSETDVCVEPVHAPHEVVDDALFAARSMFFDLNGVRHTRTPLTPMDKTHTPAPTQGEHTGEVLTSLGYDAREIAALHASGVI